MELAVAAIAVFALAAIGAATVALIVKAGRATVSPGPAHTVYPPPPGQSAVPWELASIQSQLPSKPEQPTHENLIMTVNRLSQAADLHHSGNLQPRSTGSQVQQAVIALERQLRLDETVPSPQDKRT